MSGTSSIRNFLIPPTSGKTNQKIYVTEENEQKSIGKLCAKSSEKTVRKSLQSIQPSAGEGHLTRVEPNSHIKGKTGTKPQKISAHKKSVVVYEDPDVLENVENLEVVPEDVTAGGTCHCNCHQHGTQQQEKYGKKTDKTEKTAEEEAIELMSNDNIPEEYWKVLAERRREALSETLEENEQLHQEIFTLREENQSLSELASQAEYFANLFKSLTEENEDSTSGDQSDDN